MRAVRDLPRVHLFVCANRREADNPLGPGCGRAGEEVYEALKDEVARRRAYQAVWVTQTRCLGVCPRHGATVAVYPHQSIVSEVTAAEAGALFSQALEHAT